MSVCPHTVRRKNKLMQATFFKSVILSPTTIFLFLGCMVIAISILGCEQKPPESATIYITNTPESVQVHLDSRIDENDATWSRPSETALKKGDSVTLPANAEHRLIIEKAPPAWPGISQSDISIDLIHPQKAVLSATFRDLNGQPIPNLPVEIECPTLEKDQIHPTETETDSNGLVFSVIEGSPGTHTVYVMLNGVPFFWENVELQSSQGTLVVASEPPSAQVFLNGEKTPRGSTPLVLSLDRAGKYTLKIEKTAYKPIVDKISFTGEKPITKSYILATTGTLMAKPVPKPTASAARKANEAQPVRFEQRSGTSAIPPRPQANKTITQPEDSRGMLVVTSQPLNADVYLNREKVPRGTTPLVLSLDPKQQYELKVQKTGYQPVGDVAVIVGGKPVSKSYVLTPFTVMGFLLYQGTKTPVAGAEIAIESLGYSTISDGEGRFEFRDWETYSAPEIGQKYTLRLSDPQRRFLPVTHEFDIGSSPLGVIMVDRIVTISAYVTDYSSGEPLSDANVVVNNNPAILGDRDGVFVAEITDFTKPIRLQVKKEWYETPQGSPVHEEILQIQPTTQSHFVPVALSPKLFIVELPSDWEVTDSQNVEFVARPSAQSGEEIEGTLSGRNVFFRYSPFLIVGGLVYVEMKQDSTPLNGTELKVRSSSRRDRYHLTVAAEPNLVQSRVDPRTTTDVGPRQTDADLVTHFRVKVDSKSYGPFDITAGVPKIELHREGKHIVNIEFLNELGQVVRSDPPQIVEIKAGEITQLPISGQVISGISTTASN